MKFLKYFLIKYVTKYMIYFLEVKDQRVSKFSKSSRNRAMNTIVRNRKPMTYR